MRRSKLTALVVLAAFIVTACAALCADSSWKFVIRVAGVVQCRKANAPNWVSVWNGRLLADGDRAKTLEKARAKVLLPDNSFFILGANTCVEMAKIEYTPASRFVQMTLEVGKTRVRVERFMGKDSRFEVVTPKATLAARGTEFYVEQAPPLENGAPGALRWLVFDGHVLVTTASERVEFLPGQGGSLDGAGGIQRNQPGQDCAAGTGQAASDGNVDADLSCSGIAAETISPANPYLPTLGAPQQARPSGTSPGAGAPSTPTGPSNVPAGPSIIVSPGG